MTSLETVKKKRIMQGTRGARIVCSLFSIFLSCTIFSSLAFADVLKADIVDGVTVEERNLSVSQCPSIAAKYAALISDDGSVYFERKAHQPSKIASITKVMTAMVALDHGNDDMEFVVSPLAATIGESSAGLKEGDVMDFSSVLKALLVPSGNDAAVVLAETIGEHLAQAGEDPIRMFVEEMNKKARELHLENTTYDNPHGLDEDEYAGDFHSTALDQTKVAREAMKYPEIKDIVSHGSTTIQVKRGGNMTPVQLSTTDLLLELYEHATGVKTGFTDSAGPSFLASALKEGKGLYACILGSTDEYERFEDARKLFEWGYKHIISVQLANSGSFTQSKDGVVPVIAEFPHLDWDGRFIKATLSNPNESVTVFDLSGNVSQDISFKDLHGEIREGDKIGKITFYQSNSKIKEMDLISCEDVEAPNFFQSIGIWWNKFTNNISDEQLREQAKIYNVMPIIANHASSSS